MSELIAARRSTAIEWTEHTWNPFVGCSRASDGCRNCYAERMAGQLEAMGKPAYRGLTRKGKWTGQLNRSTDATMRKPLTFRDPAVFFVNSMSDFWHPNGDDAWRAEALDIMAATSRHTYQVLTKRPELVAETLGRMGRTVPENVWLGATVEDGRVADRIAHVARFPSRVRFLSVEPIVHRFGQQDLGGINWIITGGESGAGARPLEPDWVREVRDQCTAGDIPLFHKQWGAYRNNPLVCEQRLSIAEAQRLDRHGKGGGLLDGRLWREMPRA